MLARKRLVTLSVIAIQDQAVREALKQHSEWPTYPQLYAGGEFLGGCDIILELLERGQLRSSIEAQILKSKKTEI